MENIKRESINKNKRLDDSELAHKDSLIENLLYKQTLWTSLFYVNLIFAYIGTLILVSGHNPSYSYGIIYFSLVCYIYSARNKRAEQVRQKTAHRIPFFADALANALSVGGTLEHALRQSVYYLKGEIKTDFEKLIIRWSLGKDLKLMLRDLDVKFPNTGLSYLIALLDQYRDLGIGISPLLKRVSAALTSKEEAENKTRAILGAGSSYARLSIGIFVLLFAGMTFFLRSEMILLFSPSLKPTFLFLVSWTLVGVFIVSRVTSMEFAKKFSLRPQIKHYLPERKLTTDDMMKYSGIHWSPLLKGIYYYFPVLCGFLTAYLFSLYSSKIIIIEIGLILGAYISWKAAESFLRGLVEDQLIKTIEVFPEVLQVFIIGLNSGLNTYKAFQFAEQAVSGIAPALLTRELCRTRFAMECGEDYSRTWQRLGQMLPFDTIIDFSEIMVVAPMHGESIVNSIVQMAKGYESKKMLLVEKNAEKIGQFVIPLIVMAFFPLFLYSIFAPLITNIMRSFTG